MFNSPIFDLALTLSFTYFLLGLIVSTVNEFIYSVMGCKRGLFLKEAITTLFYNDDNWKKLAVKILDQSPHIIALKKDKDSNPSYIPAQNFALALLEQFKTNVDGTYDYSLLDMNKIRAKLLDDDLANAVGIEGSVRKILIEFFERAQGDLQNFQKQIEDYYNSAMDRGAGVYIRNTKKTILALSFILAIGLNVDSVHIAKTLWSNPDALAQTADNIQQTVKNISPDESGKFRLTDIKFQNNQVIITKDSVVKKEAKALKDTSKLEDTTQTGKATVQKDTANVIATADTLVHNIQQSVIYLKSTGIPIGWTCDNIPQGSCWEFIWELLIKIIGIAITAFALSLGAPFWFDLINKIVNIRGTGKKPDEATTNTAANNSTTSSSSTQNPVG